MITHSGAKIAVARMGGMSASGGPKNGISIARVEAVTMRKPYGSSSHDDHDRRQHRLDRGKDDLRAQEAAEGGGHRALQDLELVAVPARHRPLELGENRLAVGEHVQAEDHHQDERSEDREGHLGDLPERRGRGGRHGCFHVAVQRHEVGPEGAERGEVGPVAQRALDPCLGQREVGGRLRHVRADGGRGPEEQEASADHRRGIHESDGDAAR